MTPGQLEAWRLVSDEGMSHREAAEELGISKSTLQERLKRAKKHIDAKEARLSPGVAKTRRDAGLGDARGAHSGWVHHELDDGRWVSEYYFLGKDGEASSIADIVRDAVENSGQIPARPKTPKAHGDHCMVLNLADLHVGRLCTKEETGHEYNTDIAIERASYGTQMLLKRAKSSGIEHIIIMLGNDKAHFDTPKQSTTAGTFQQADATIHQMYRACKLVDRTIIDLCREVAPVTLVYVPSNHDWIIGYALAQDIKSYYRNCPEVSFSDYNASERHRKYAVWSGALMMFTHGDGAKAADLPGLIMHEARDYLSSCKHAYCYTAHLHHKTRQTLAPGACQIEKDLPGLTVLNGRTDELGQGVEIEVVRSPAPPDGWHHRNGYVNRQAVEAFLHDDSGAQVARFTEWF